MQRILNDRHKKLYFYYQNMNNLIETDINSTTYIQIVLFNSGIFFKRYTIYAVIKTIQTAPIVL